MAKEKKNSADVMFETPTTLEIEGKTYRFAPLKLRQLREFLPLMNELLPIPFSQLMADDALCAKVIRALEMCFAAHHPEMKGDLLLDTLDADSATRVLELVIDISGPKKA